MPSRAIRISKFPQNGGSQRCTGGCPFFETLRAADAIPSAVGISFCFCFLMPLSVPFFLKEVIFLFRIAPNNYANNLNLNKVDQVIFSIAGGYCQFKKIGYKILPKRLHMDIPLASTSRIEKKPELSKR